MSKNSVEWVAGGPSQLAYYDMEARLEADYQVSIIVAEPWLFVGRDDGESYGAVVVGALDLDACGYPMVVAAYVGYTPVVDGVADAHLAALNALRSLEEMLELSPIPFVPTAVVK